jgi:hypothetical protein
MGGSWHSTWGVRPRITAFSSFYEIRRIRWSSWTSSNAYGRGHLVACAGAAGPCHNGVVNSHLYAVHSHSGPGRYFSNLRYSGSHARHLWITSRGYWNWR